MSTIANVPKACSLLEDFRSWTDALPVCKDSGLSTNSVHREVGHWQEEHPFEDKSIRVHYNDSVQLYGVFDGHDGAQLAKVALDQICAEILLGDLENQTTDKGVKSVLREAFNIAERNYLQTIGDKLAVRMSLNLVIPDNLTPYEAYRQYPLIVDKLNTINTELSCGTTAVISLIYRKQLYVANVGDSRALLCRTDDKGVLRVIQLSQDHVSSNEDEILRLTTLGIPKDKLRPGFHTRCLGHYLLKGAYKENEDLACASSEPVIAVPDITGGIPLDCSCRFLMLMSNGLYKSLEEATGTQCVNKEIAQMVVDQFRTESTLNSVAQAVVDRVVRIYNDYYTSVTGSERIPIAKREDITLLIRNFNFPLPNAIPPSEVGEFNRLCDLPIQTNSGIATYSETTSDPTTWDNSSCGSGRRQPTNPTEKVKAYVDFSKFYDNVEKSKKLGNFPQEDELLF